MGLFDILSKKNGSKGVEILDDESIKKQNRAQTSQYCDYIKSNFARVCKLLADLQNETQSLISHITSMKGVKMSFREKGDLRKTKEKANKSLQYLYLSRDFFTALSKNASGIALQNEELGLVTKFAPYFDGVPVLDIDDEDSDDSVLGAFKEVGHKLMSAFVSSKKGSKYFDFEDYLSRYEEKLEEFVMPDLDSAIASFRNVTSMQETSTSTPHTKVVVCPSCGANLANTDALGECEYCGTPLR